MATVFPFVVLAGPAAWRDRVLDSLRHADPEKHHMGRLVPLDERLILQGWRDEDELLARRGRAPRGHFILSLCYVQQNPKRCMRCGVTL